MVPARTLMHALMAAALLPALAGCSGGDDPAVSDPAVQAAASQAQAAFQAEQDQWRDRRLDDLLKPDGWTSLTGLHWLQVRKHFVGSGPENGIRLPQGPEKLGLVDLEPDGTVYFTPASGVTVLRGDAPLRGRTRLQTDADGQSADVITFDDGKGSASVIKRGQRHALRTRHADAYTRTGFTRLEYWPANPDWTLPARFIANPPGSTQEVVTLINTVEQLPNPGVLEFEHGGATHRLQALDDGSDMLFVIFADRTNRDQSYSAGRYLAVPRPDGNGNTRIDFNQSYNPPCVFTDYATCPLPPRENRLNIAIEAGEKRYARPKPPAES